MITQISSQIWIFIRKSSKVIKFVITQNSQTKIHFYMKNIQLLTSSISGTENNCISRKVMGFPFRDETLNIIDHNQHIF